MGHFKVESDQEVVKETRDSQLDYELRQWGHWSRSKGLHLDMSVPGNSVSPDITDLRALQIDRVIAILGKRDPISAKLLMKKFVEQRSERQMVVDMKLSRAKVQLYLKVGFGCVAMALDMSVANDD